MTPITTPKNFTVPASKPHQWRRLRVGSFLSVALVLGCDSGPTEVAPDGSSVEPSVDAAPQAPDAATLPSAAPVDISLGDSHACAVISDGRVACWGQNNKGQLGDGTLVTRAAPVFVEGLDDATAVFAGGSYTCAIHEDRTVSCWGDNWRGNLGIGTTENRLTPTPVSGLTNVVTLAVSQPIARKHTCAVIDDGSLWCWGTNHYGAVGTGQATDDILSPVEAVVAGEGIVSVAHGYDWTCASYEDGSARCWGRDYWDVLGRGETNSTPPGFSELLVEPESSVAELTDTVLLSNSGGHSCALQESGRARCWGPQHSGQLGGGPSDAGGNHAIDVDAIHAIKAGGSFTCMIAGDDREVLCLGANWAGQCGSPSQEFVEEFGYIYAPTSVPGLENTSVLSAGNRFSCAIADDELKCWGSNTFGQLGANVAETFSETPLVVDLSNLNL